MKGRHTHTQGGGRPPIIGAIGRLRIGTLAGMDWWRWPGVARWDAPRSADRLFATEDGKTDPSSQDRGSLEEGRLGIRQTGPHLPYAPPTRYTGAVRDWARQFGGLPLRTASSRCPQESNPQKKSAHSKPLLIGHTRNPPDDCPPKIIQQTLDRYRLERTSSQTNQPIA